MIRKRHLCIPVLVLAMTGVAAAAELPAFGDLDKDGDGFLSREESADVPGLLENFSILDQDGDGRLNPVEYSVVEGPTGRFHEPAIIYI